MYMSKSQSELEQTIGMEDLFSLGGFVEEIARGIIKEKWAAVLPTMAWDLGAKRYVNSFDQPNQILFEIVDNYDANSSEDSLYQLVQDRLEDYFLALKNETSDYDADDFCNNSED